MPQQQSTLSPTALMFIKYSRIIKLLCILLLLYFPADVYMYLSSDIPPGHNFQTAGRLLGDAFTYVAVPAAFLAYLRKLKKVTESDPLAADSTR